MDELEDFFRSASSMQQTPCIAAFGSQTTNTASCRISINLQCSKYGNLQQFRLFAVVHGAAPQSQARIRGT